ncbi:MAG: methionine--tRNA ligase subunit beta, partial [Methanococcoides sp.]|nr:methionine--tRNA ligase subunit beta [Methanococcoides sp.]
EATELVKSGTTLEKPSILFEKIEDEKTEEMEAISAARVKEAIAKESGTEEVEEVKEIEEMKDLITFDDFSKMDIRIGTIVSAEAIKKSKKLLKLQVDLGEEETRQIVAGLKESHEPEQLIGKQVAVLTNLAPAKLCGVESNGMVLAGVDAADNAILLQPEKETNPGTCIH